MALLEYLIGFALWILLGYFYLTWKFDFWKNQNVKGPVPSPVFGNIKDLILIKLSIGDMITKFYNQFPDEPLIGFFARRTPILIVKDPEVIKTVLIRDFSTFANRGIPFYEKLEPLFCHLFFVEAERWKPLRQNLSPVFTSGKLREMFYLLLECADHFGEFLTKYTATHPEIECRDLTAKFATDVIGVCAFGLKMNALDDVDSEFRKMGRKIFAVSRWKAFVMVIKNAAPWLYQLMGPLVVEKELDEFFINTITQTMDYRKKNNVKRNDFVDLLVEIRENPHKLGDNIKCTDSLLTAQAFVFFAAGFETSSTTISNALYELALNPPIQNKLRQEISETYRDSKGKLKYENIKDMKYLHKVFCETLRKYPPVPVLMRQALKDYTFSDYNVKIFKNQKVFIPAYAIHRDPKIYPDPDKFDPERFAEDNIKLRHPSHYLPFGDGPRNCIGSRFANYQSKIGLMTILKDYEVRTCKNTCIPYVNEPKGFLLSPKGGIILEFVKLKN